MAIATGTALAIAAGVGAGTSIYGAHKQAKAAEKASEQQQGAANHALQYLAPGAFGGGGGGSGFGGGPYGQALQIAQEQNALGRAGLQPFAAAGTQGMTALSSLLGLPAQAGVGAPAMPAPVNRAGMAPPQMAGGMGGAQGMVMLKAPTGQTQAVPATQVDFYLARGAQRV